jgi:hypothetical protein
VTISQFRNCVSTFSGSSQGQGMLAMNPKKQFNQSARRSSDRTPSDDKKRGVAPAVFYRIRGMACGLRKSAASSCRWHARLEIASRLLHSIENSEPQVAELP